MGIAQVSENECAAEVTEENLTHPHRPNQEAEEYTQPLFHQDNQRCTRPVGRDSHAG
jgi:hypothetical protein